MIRPLLALMLVASASPALAEDRPDGLLDIPVFACGTGEDASEGMLVLRGGTNDEGRIEAIQFVEQDRDIETASWPENGRAGRQSFAFSNSHGPEGYVFVVRWSRSDLSYALYSHVKPENEEGITEGLAGLVVLDAMGQVRRSVACTERPSVYLDLLSEGTSCDEQSPTGTASCDVFNPPVRSTSLAALYPWLPTE